jgi:uncharacterized protein YodC (DUF2158 family)
MKTGQVVRLKTGGPLMAIVEVQPPVGVAAAIEERLVDCVWFEGKAFVRGKFTADALECLAAPSAAGAHV